ncbi:hypothetical protein SLS58_011074 [Diplodia intermedia]|uniref:Pisatin demethylase n=1 Tax=Diplodia intermedia TaxID=856260 RepID=A0ABR3T1K6_9PEZI
MEMNYQYLLLFLLIFILERLSRTVYSTFRRGIRRVPGPLAAKLTPYWRIGLVWSGDAHEKYRALHARYGPMVRTAPHVVDISDPAAIPTIYGIKSRFLKSAFYHPFTPVYENRPMDNMFTTTDAAEHRALKRPVAQKYSMTSVSALEYLVEPCTQVFTDAMLDLQGQPVDLGEWVQWYAFDAIGKITFGAAFGFLERRRDVHGAIRSIETALQYSGIVGQVPWLHPYLMGNMRLRATVQKLAFGDRDALEIITEMVLNSIAEYDAGGGSGGSDDDDRGRRGDFLAYLRQQQKAAGSAMSTRELMNHLMGNLLAGSDTTAISLRAIFYYVMRDERIYRKLQREIDDAHAAGNLSEFVTYSECLQLEYLQACMKEAMRMHPGVSYPLERVVPEGGTELCGHYLPPGTIVGVNAAVIHRDRGVFGEDADQFRPERWMEDETKAKEMERNLLTFGAGARTCIGKNISIMEMGKLVPQVLRQFELEWASSEPEWKVTTYWFAKQTGLLVRFKPRMRQ